MILEIIGFIIFLIMVLAICAYISDDLSEWQDYCIILLVLFFLITFIAGNNLLRGVYLFTSIIVLLLFYIKNSKLFAKKESDYKPRERYNKNNTNTNSNTNIPKNKPEQDNKIEHESNNRIESEPNNIEQDEEPIVKPEETIEIKKDKIDINMATQEELSSLNALNLIQSKKIIQFRNNGRYIKSYDDLRDMLNLKDYQIKQIKDETFIDEKTIPSSQGRIVDL